MTVFPPELVERARALRDGRLEPAVARDAATVVLLRDGAAGPQAYLLRRVKAMAFAGGMHVFPGGSVDPADAQADIAWAGPPPSRWALAFGADEPRARALVCAAVRETFEECGVLLAGPSQHELLADVSSPEWEAERAALEARQQSLSELLARRRLFLRADLLRPLAHWITPELEPRRFDTRFFLAAMPSGQVTRHVGGEADIRVWVRPRDALEQGLAMMPPTAATLSDLAAAADVQEALDTARTIAPVQPHFELDGDDELVLVVP